LIDKWAIGVCREPNPCQLALCSLSANSPIRL